VQFPIRVLPLLGHVVGYPPKSTPATPAPKTNKLTASAMLFKLDRLPNILLVFPAKTQIMRLSQPIFPN